MATSIAFPNMFTTAKTLTLSDKESVRKDLYLLLKSVKGTLFGDPYYGTDFIKYIYRQNNTILIDLLKDEIYTCILNYMPQITVKRDDIVLSSEGSAIYANITCLNKINGSHDLYSIRLIDEGEV